MKWIDLRDKTSGARLKSGPINGANFLWIVSLPNTSPKWQQAIDLLGFTGSPNKKFLLRPVRPEDKTLTAKSLHAVWPDATYAEMETDKVVLHLNRPTATAKDRTDEERDLKAELNNARRLGRNADGDEVYQSAAGRFIYRDSSGVNGITRETQSLRQAMFLYAPDATSFDICADGFVKSMLMGEVQRTDDFERFLSAVNTPPGAALSIEFSAQQRDVAHEAIDSAVMRFLSNEYATPNDAYGDANRLYDYLPPYRGTARGKGAMPVPLSIIAQRLLGDTAGKTVVLPNAYDGAAFSFLAEGTTIRAFKGKRDLSIRARGLQREGLEWLDEFHHARESNAQAMFFNADPTVSADGARLDYRDALLAVRSLAADGRAVLVVAADRADHPGDLSVQGRTFLEKLYLNYEIEDAFDVGRELMTRVGTEAALRVIALRNRQATHGAQQVAPTLPVCHSWDEIKTRVDESLARSAIKEQESDGIDLEKIAEENKLQRPYIAFSRVSEATTMVPKELQSPLQTYYSEFEANFGSVDSFVERELGFGENTLSECFSAEQVDAIAMMIARIKQGRGHIIGDETGIGKGRSLAALVTWALKNDQPVVFVTNGAHLFSDLTRDLRDIGEWGRVRPFIMNADGQIQDNIGNDGILAEGTKVSEMRRILEGNIPLSELGANVIFTTYSQLSGADSEKALWLKNQMKEALLIVDESHVAAGSDSNIATQIAEMTALAKGVQYSSATWAKSSENLHIYARAFPESVNVATLAQTMKRGGEAFSEVFSTMLAREGALIRREHDLSKLEFVVEVDNDNLTRNVAVADHVSEIMGAMAYASGDLKRMVSRMSDINIATLKEARDARNNAARSTIFKSRFGTGSMLYQVHRRVNAALNADNAVRLALEGIEAGRKPVIVFEDTGEAFVKEALQMQATIDAQGKHVLPSVVTPPTIKDLMMRMLDSLQMVKVQEVGIEDLPFIDSDAEDAEVEEALEVVGLDAGENTPPLPATEIAGDEPQVRPVAAAIDAGVDATRVGEAAAEALSDDDAGISDPSKRKRRGKPRFKLVPLWELDNVSESDRERFKSGMDEIKRRINAMAEIQLNAPDEITRRLTERGIRVGELSGRSFTLRPIEAIAEEAPPGQGTAPARRSTLCQIIHRQKGKQALNATVRAFNGGDLDVVLMNRAVATGISLHASPRFVDRRRRQLIEMQIPENPTDRIQLYGRVNRFDQESFPLIQVATTGNYGEVRQIMVQNKKLSEMSANVRSSRDSHALIKDVPDLLNVIGREICRTFLEENPEVLSRLDIDPARVEDGQGDFAHLLTSRIPLLRSEEQGPVYEQIYALFEDAILEAELAGSNPLKPNELDVRARMSNRHLMFGYDHQGFGSAFDGPVFAQRLDWKEDVRPMALEAVVGIIESNRAKLVESGRGTKTGERANGTPNLDLSGPAKRAVAQLDARVRLAMANPEMRKYRNLEEALAAGRAHVKGVQIPATLKSMVKMQARARWLERHLPKLVPGRVIDVTEPLGNGQGSQGKSFRSRTAVILDVIPPPDKRESQLVRWRVLTISPGESKPRSSTLNALVGTVMTYGGGRQSAGSLTEGVDAAGTVGTQAPEHISTRLRIGTDFLDLVDATDVAREDMRGSWFYDDFKRPFSGERNRNALVLTGNMYLASEWASQTKAGTGVIFSDDRGLRHRGILLQEKFKPEWLRYLPVRLWTKTMMHDFVDRLLADEMREHMPVTGFKVHTSFDTAWKATEESRSGGEPGALRIIPGTGILMSVGVKSRNRINGMLRQAQKKIKALVFNGEKVAVRDDPAHVIIKEPDTKAGRAAARASRRAGEGAPAQASSRKESPFIVMQADTPEKLHRAIEMLVTGPGLELFVPSATDLGQVARECIREFFVRQLRSNAADDPARAAKLEEFLERDRIASLAVEGVDTSDESEIRALFAELGQRSEEAQTRQAEQRDFNFEGGAPPVEEDAEATSQAHPAGASAEPVIDVAALFAPARRGPRRGGAVEEAAEGEGGLPGEAGNPGTTPEEQAPRPRMVA